MSNKTVIKIKAGSKGHLFLQEMKKLKEERNQEFMKSQPPKFIRDHVKDKSRKTATLNKKTSFNEESFRLGMYAMWYYLYDKKMLNSEQSAKDGDSSTGNKK